MLQIRRRFAALASDLASTSDRSRYRPVIGLEVHVQLNTRTKLFSRTLNEEAPPNRLVGPFDMATPGWLPAINKKCVMHALKLGMLLNCDIPKASRFDRKHYFYADMPAGYQITQTDEPIAKNGKFGFYVFDDTMTPYWKMAEIVQLQLEQDSGKTIHMDGKSMIDYNRAGCALVEVVTSPCFSTALEAICFVQHLRLILKHYGICEGELHKGNIRVDANVSLSFDRNEGVRTEIKNMNSIRCIHTAINYEISRQFEVLSMGGRVLNETRGTDSEGRTVQMRDKEEETDYRYMKEPNLPMLVINNEWREVCADEIQKMPKPEFEIFRDDVGFDARTAVHLARCLDAMRNGQKVEAADILYWMKELKTIMQRSKLNYPPPGRFFASQFVSLIRFYNSEKLTRLRMLDLLRTYSCTDENRDVTQLIESGDYWKIGDKSEIERIVDGFLRKNEKLLAKCRNGHAKSFNKLRNEIIDKTDKKIEVGDIENAMKMIIKS
ncbi:unnamed protein product [Caenorhabditis bovis]|uniref:Glutamyl-tRNA(Gln) amidotransferase subunit B, mitochondrial n=1 Tax=Caenorhabditis bovis TaxID=2654633 RepID=A0A8S1EVH8_9PELO|nr:unnamed protein product [Caenorhabditis bovis]